MMGRLVEKPFTDREEIINYYIEQDVNNALSIFHKDDHRGDGWELSVPSNERILDSYYTTHKSVSNTAILSVQSKLTLMANKTG